ncbi:MAG: phosphatase domain-containing protein [Candidatus Binatia bacterium]
MMALRLSRRRPTAAAPPLLCRWDLDKTYLRSEFETLGQLWRTARERGADKVEVPGVPEVLKALRVAADRRGRALGIYFVSASPPQIGKAIRDKLALDGVPYDGIVFKNQLEHLKRGKLRQLREHVGFKLGVLLRGRLAASADTRELLFGDDWESDPLTYSLYADVLDGTLGAERLALVLGRIGADPALVPELRLLAGQASGAGGVERIFINLERRTPPAVFRLYGVRLVPTFNYFQTALVLAAEGYIEVGDVERVARSLVDRSGYSARRLENSLADLVRRRLLTSDAARLLAGPLREAALLPASAGRRRGWLRRTVGRLGRRSRLGSAIPTIARATPLDYEAILDRLEAAKASA